MKKKSKYLLLFSLFSFLTFSIVSCGDDNDEGKNDVVSTKITVDRSKVFLTQGKSTTITIETGNGDYVVTTSNENIITATVRDNTVTITSVSDEERANAVVIISDKAGEKAIVGIEVAKILDLQLNTNQASMEIGIEGREEVVVKILSGNFGYKIQLTDNSDQLLAVDTTGIELANKFKIKAIAAGTAKVKVSDAQGKESTIEITITKPQKLTVDKTKLQINAVQGSEVLTVLSGNGKYNVKFAKPFVAKATMDGNSITITGKRNGKTTFTVEDEKGEVSEAIAVEVNGPEYSMHLGNNYFCYANYKELAAVDMSVRSCEQVTFEITCKMSNYRGLQTFMGLEGKLIMRGKNDDYKDTHPIEIAGLGDKIMMLSTNSFKLNEWMNLALVVDCSKYDVAQKYKLYVNGEQETLQFTRQEETHSSVDLMSSSDDNKFEIGCAAKQDWRAMLGTVSEARVWTVARTAQQIKDNMCTLTETNPAGLLSRWDFTAGCETDYIQDINGGKYQTNLTIAKIQGNFSFAPVTVPSSVFVSKGCPN